MCTIPPDHQLGNMRWYLLIFSFFALCPWGRCQSTQGLTDLVRRRLPSHVDDISFKLVPGNHVSGVTNDQYSVKCDAGKVSVEGNSFSALASGSVIPP